MIRQKVSIIGSGLVGSTIGYTLMLRGVANEIVLIDVNKNKAEGEALDMNHGLDFVNPVQIFGGDDYSLTKDSDIVVITAGTGRKPGESRFDLFSRNASILKGIISEVVKYAHSETVILMVTNPVDLLTYAAFKFSGFSKERVIGSGTMLDTARFKYYIGDYANVDVRSVNTYLLGEHGDTEVAAWSMTNIAAIDIEKFCQVNHIAGQSSSDIIPLDDFQMKTKNAGQEVISKKGSTNFAIALAVTKMTECILNNENSILTVSSLLEGEYGINDVCLSVPTIVASGGAQKILEMPLTNTELSDLRKSACILKDMLKNLEL